MNKVLQCECGFVARAADEVELAAEIRRHAQKAHSMTLSPDEALLLASRADLVPPRAAESASDGKEQR